MQALSTFWRDERGATAVEYALIASIVSVVIVGGISIMTDGVLEMYTDIRDAINNAIGQ